MIAIETALSLAPLRPYPNLSRPVPESAERLSASLGLIGLSNTSAAQTHPSRIGGSVVAPEFLTVPGMRLGSYELLERLGQGCQAEVWRAQAFDGHGEDVALKILSPVLARDPKRLAQFHHEAERGARICGPAVLTTYEFGQSDGHLFIAMPFVDGCSLSDLVAWRRNPETPSPPRLHSLASASIAEYRRGIVRVMARVARGLGGVHEAGVVHRDIKPANILIDRRYPDAGFLCDFGLGRDLDVATPAQLRDGAGTPLYMAPERLLRRRADERLCDIYAFGASLFEAITLAPPFELPDGLPWHAWHKYLADARATPPSAVATGIPETLDRIILKSLARHPDERYLSADALADDLDRFLAGKPVYIRLPAW